MWSRLADAEKERADAAKSNGDGVSGIFSVPGGCQNILILLENLKKDRMYLVEM